MNLDFTDNELMMIGEALKQYAGYALEHGGHDGADVLQVEIMGRALCSKILRAVDFGHVQKGIEDAFVDARNEFCGIADDCELAASCKMGAMDGEGLEKATAIIKDAKQRQEFKANYKKVLAHLKMNMEQNK
ncbi:MAG: hypothetical protein HUK20_11745 [Fibrobacter sp.]|nr:hypothetical protein [Fibrobacter sp.]